VSVAVSMPVYGRDRTIVGEISSASQEQSGGIQQASALRHAVAVFRLPQAA